MTRNITIFDTTLRDGEQCPGASMSVQEKLRIAEILDALRIDIVEAGFPVASKGDFMAVQEVSKQMRYSKVCALTRTLRGDIDAAGEALKGTDNKRIHTFISTSPLHMKYKIKKTPEQVLEAITDSVIYARNYVDDVEWSCEDGTRSDMDFLCRCFETAIKAGAKTVNIADTVGYILPEVFDALIKELFERVPNIDDVTFSVHCHDDLGLATANSITAISNGARQVECTVNGLGERAGNASLEEIVMSIATHQKELDCKTNVNTKLLTEASQLVSEITGFAVSPNKAVVGSNAFAHESGIHQHGILNHRGTYEIMDPYDVGAKGSKIVFGKHSGRHALKSRLEELGVSLSHNALDDIFTKFKALADDYKEVTNQQLLALVDNSFDTHNEFEVTRLVVSSEQGRYHAKLQLKNEENTFDASSVGSNLWEVLATAVKQVIPHEQHVTFFKNYVIGDTKSPQIKVLLHLGDERHPLIGQGISEDMNIAFVKAYLQALSAIEKGQDLINIKAGS